MPLQFSAHRTVFLLLCLSLIMVPAYAAVTLEQDSDSTLGTDLGVFKGTIVLTYPDGRIVILEPGEPLPEIPSGSAMEIFDGHFMIRTEEGDNVTIGALGFTFQAGNGSTATLISNETEGRVIVRSGFVTLTDEAGETITIQAPNEFPFVVGQVIKAPPAAESEKTGFDIEGNPLPDPTSIDVDVPSPGAPGSTTPSA